MDNGKELTPDQPELERQWNKIAGESVSVTVLDDEIYAFGSEIACLRLAYRFSKSHIRVYPSKKADGWFFVKYQEKKQQ